MNQYVLGCLRLSAVYLLLRLESQTTAYLSIYWSRLFVVNHKKLKQNLRQSNAFPLFCRIYLLILSHLYMRSSFLKMWLFANVLSMEPKIILPDRKETLVWSCDGIPSKHLV